MSAMGQLVSMRSKNRLPIFREWSDGGRIQVILTKIQAIHHPMLLNLYTNNRMEVLVDTLVAALREPRVSAFTQEVIFKSDRLPGNGVLRFDPKDFNNLHAVIVADGDRESFCYD